MLGHRGPGQQPLWTAAACCRFHPAACCGGRRLSSTPSFRTTGSQVSHAIETPGWFTPAWLASGKRQQGCRSPCGNLPGRRILKRVSIFRVSKTRAGRQAATSPCAANLHSIHPTGSAAAAALDCGSLLPPSSRSLLRWSRTPLRPPASAPPGRRLETHRNPREVHASRLASGKRQQDCRSPCRNLPGLNPEAGSIVIPSTGNPSSLKPAKFRASARQFSD